jgi:hypothetical protein
VEKARHAADGAVAVQRRDRRLRQLRLKFHCATVTAAANLHDARATGPCASRQEEAASKSTRP